MSKTIFGELFTQGLGCSTFMPNEILDSICDAAHFNLITSVETLAKETRWHLAKDHGESVVQIILETFPPASSQLLVPPVVLVTSTSGPKAREMICTSCGQPGHSSESSDRIHRSNID